MWIKNSAVSRKGKLSMNDHSKLKDEEFIKAYETPYTKEEREEHYKVVDGQIKNGEFEELTDGLIDEIFEKD